MQKISPQTKSFLILAGIAVVGTYLTFFTYGFLQRVQHASPNSTRAATQILNLKTQDENKILKEVEVLPADTTGWKTYTDSRHGFNFLYDPSWKVLKPKIGETYYVVEINPGLKFVNMKVIVSNRGFYALDGLGAVKENINGDIAYNVGNQLYGLKHGDYYYTFDIGWSLSLKPKFLAMVHSVSFTSDKALKFP